MYIKMSERRQTATGGREATTGIIPGQFALSVGDPGTPTPNGWKWVKLTDIARLESGHTPSRKHPEYWDGDIPWIGIKDATSNHGRVIDDTIQHVTQLGIDNSSARILPAGTVCLSRTASVGYVVVMNLPMATSQDFVNWVCSDEIDFRYLAAILFAENKSFSSFSHGTTHQTIYFPEVKAFHVLLPPREEQARLTNFIASIFDKIDLNRRMNASLEAMAQAIFKSWFADFDPVQAKMAGRQPVGMDADTAALFPDRLVDSGTELGEIPEGWEVKTIEDIAKYINGRNFTKNASGTGRMVIRIAELNSGPGTSTVYNEVNAAAENIAEPDDILFAWSGSLDVYRWYQSDALINQHIFKVLCSKYPKWFVYYHLRMAMPFFKSIASHKATTMGHIKRGHLRDVKIAGPNDVLLDSSSRIIEPLYNRILENEVESQSLASLRDALLPRLMSGELRVRGATE